MENQQTYQINIEEVENEEYKDVREIFSCFQYTLYENGEKLGTVVIDGINVLRGLPAALRCLADKLDPAEE